MAMLLMTSDRNVKRDREMKRVMLSLLGVLLGIFGTLAWTGWHFFVQGGPRRQPVSSPVANPRMHVFRLASCWPFALLPAIAAIVTVAVNNIAATSATEPLSAQVMYRIPNIRTALNPERLVPPPPLPAAMFLGTEIPGLETADRSWEKLDPAFMQRALTVFARVEARGYQLALLEGYRSPERQDSLAGLGPHVTRARAYQSQHQYGLALDAAPVMNGRLVISERDPWAMQAYQALGEEAEKAGLVWGGRWALRDYGHIEAFDRPHNVRSPK